MKISENNFETPKGCLSCSIRLGNHFFPNWEQKKLRISFSRKMSHSAEKCKKGDPLGFINIHSVAKYQKTRRGLFGDTKKFSKKVPQCQKKSIERPFSLVRIYRLR